MSYKWIRGATATMSLRVRSGSVTGSEVVRCALKRNGQKGSFSLGTQPEVIVLSPVFVGASGDMPARWDFTATATQTSGLTPGDYLLDARIEIGGGVVQTERVGITVAERVTGPSV